MKLVGFWIYTLFALAIQGCEDKSSDKLSSDESSNIRLKSFVEGVKKDLVFVEGGEFLMGDFGEQHSTEGLPYDENKDSKPLHKVSLVSYSMDRFKVTNERYQFYLTFNHVALREKGMTRKSEWDSLNAIPVLPAHVDWYEAEKYCQWLREITDLPFALPTEAQWEYAARSRGQYLMVATDSGEYKAEPVTMGVESYMPRGINISSDGNREAYARKKGLQTENLTPLPVDMFPPNPLGLYSMSDNGYEWVGDWYDPDYYLNSPLNDPQGPELPIFKDQFGHYTKVLRGQSFANPYWGGGVNVFRRPMDPLGRLYEDEAVFIADKTMRCVVNSPEPISMGSPSE